MKKTVKRLLVCIIMLNIITAASLTVNAATIPVLPTDVDTPADGNIFVGIEGSYPEMKTALAKMNKVRLEACKEGVPNPDNPSKKLTMDDYVPLKWSRDLEEICRIRAAEAAVGNSHDRLNGESYSIRTRNVYGYAETLAEYSELGYTYKEGDDGNGISSWETEKEAWVNREKDKPTGHYTSMIDPRTRYVGVATFYIPSEDLISHAAQYIGELYDDNDNIIKVDESRLKPVDRCIQTIEIKKEYVSGPKIVRPYPIPEWVLDSKGYDRMRKDQKPLAVKESEQYICVYDVIDQYILDSGYISRLKVLGDVKWSSDKASAISISDKGVAVYKKKGKAKIAASLNGQVIADRTLNVSLKAVGQASINKLKGGKKQLTITVKLKDNTSGYDIQYCKNKKFADGTTFITYAPKSRSNGYVLRFMPKGTFYVRVRGYKEIKQYTVTSPWSKAKKVKIR